MSINEAHRLKDLEKQNSRLKRLLAERMLENGLLKELLKKGVPMAERRAVVQVFVAGGLSVRRACAVVQIHQSTFHYAAHPPDDTALLTELEHLAAHIPAMGTVGLVRS